MEKELYTRRHRDYAVFSNIFANPISNQIKQVIIELFDSLIVFAKQIGNDNLETNIEFVINFLKNNQEEELNRIYTSLFISGAYGKILCPVESIYLDNAGIVMGEKRDIVLEIYAKDKLSLSETFKEQEDHIAAELSYISVKNGDDVFKTIKYSVDSYIRNINEQYNFVTDHLLPLIHYLILDLKKYDKSMLYYKIAYIIKEYIEYDFIKNYE